MTSLGKISAAEFQSSIAPRLGAARPEVSVGPGVGRDSAILKVGAGRVMAVTTDPLSLIPAIGPETSAWLACHLLASDVWASGIPPAYVTTSLALPPSLDASVFDAWWAALSRELERLGIAIVAGHTGRYAGCDLTIVGAATMWGFGDEGRFVGPSFIQPGDKVLMTKDCAVEAVGIAARLFPKMLAERLDEEQLERARKRLDDASVVADCRAAVRVGVRDRGVSAMHDATEGGVLAALLELAQASGTDLRVVEAAMLRSPEARAVCDRLGLDPLWTLSEGTLIATVRPAWALEVVGALADEGIAAAEIGEVVRGDGAVWLTREDARIEKITGPRPDGWWDTYARGIAEGWS